MAQNEKQKPSPSPQPSPPQPSPQQSELLGPLARFAQNSGRLHQEVKERFPHLTDEQVQQLIDFET